MAQEVERTRSAEVEVVVEEVDQSAINLSLEDNKVLFISNTNFQLSCFDVLSCKYSCHIIAT